MYTVIGLVGAAVNGGHGAGRACGLACARLPGRLTNVAAYRAPTCSLAHAGALNPVYFLIFGWLVNDFGNLATNASFDFMGQVQRQEAPPTHTRAAGLATCICRRSQLSPTPRSTLANISAGMFSTFYTSPSGPCCLGMSAT